MMVSFVTGSNKLLFYLIKIDIYDQLKAKYKHWAEEVYRTNSSH